MLPVHVTAAPTGLFSSEPPAFSEGEAAAMARVQFGLSGRIRPLAAERDQNFRLDRDDGHAFVLKIANTAEDPAVIDFQTGALLHVAARDPGCPVPRLWPARDGAPWVRVLGPDGAAHVVWMQTLLPGVALSDLPVTDARRRAAGAALARLGLALAGYHHPVARHHMLWDLRHAGELVPLLPHIAGPAERGLAEAALARFAEAVAPVLDSLPAQVVHNDLNPSNILMAADDPDRISGLIDFGDLVETARVNDVAVAAAYLVARDGDPLDGVVPFLAGYAGVTPLGAAEARLLPELIATRMAMTLTVANWRAARYPQNRTYLLRNTAVAASGLARLAALDPQAARDRLVAVATTGKDPS